MKGFVIAAGMGVRMKGLTQARPKCMLPVGGRPMLHQTLERLREIGCTELVVIGGHLADRLDAPGATIVLNDDFRNNNILHSLMYARHLMEGPCVCTYSDIWVEPRVYEGIRAATADIVLSIDSDWAAYYVGRTDHPVSQAENAFYDETGAVHDVGKSVDPSTAGALGCGEFVGLWRMSTEGTRAFRAAFDAVDSRLGPTEPFQRTAQWRKAYVTDLFMEMIGQGQRLDASLHTGGWAELDTVQDYERLEAIAHTRGLDTLTRG